MTQKLVKSSYSLRNNRGTIILPAWVTRSLNNLVVPEDIYAGDSIQGYPLGTKLYKDGKVYRYGKAGSTSASVAFLHGNANYEPGATGHENVDGFEGALYAAVVAGDTEIKIADTTARALNYYEDAELVLEYDAGVFIHQYKVVASDVGTTAYVKLYIAPPGAKAACPVSGTVVDAYMSRYSNVVGGSALNFDYATAIGAIGVGVTSGKYYWYQTGGLISLTGTAGYTTGKRMVFPNTDGSVLCDPHVTSGQVVGYVTGRTISSYGSLLVNLAIDT
jgi:hypothetical protein